MKNKEIRKLLGDFIYVHYYHKKVINRLLVIGFFRKWLKFKLFFYINC